MADEQIYSIVNGPSQWAFVLSVFEGDSQSRKFIDFTVELNGVKGAIRCMLESAAREDGSGTCWMFQAHVEQLVFNNEGKGLEDLSRFGELSLAFRGVRSIHGFYSMRDRKGWLAPGFAFPTKP